MSAPGFRHSSARAPSSPQGKEDHPIDGIFCNDYGAKLDEAPTLLPEQRPPCPRCGSLARRFEQTITNTVVLSDGGTATDALNVAKADGPTAIAHAQPATLTVTAHDATVSIEANAEVAEGVGEAFDATVETRSGTARVEARVEGRASGVRLPRRVADQLVLMGRLLEWTPLSGHLGRMTRSLWWVQLSEQPTWLVQVVDETGELIGGGIELENDQIDAFVGVAKDLLPSGAGPTLLTIRDQAGETLPAGSDMTASRASPPWSSIFSRATRGRRSSRDPGPADRLARPRVHGQAGGHFRRRLAVGKLDRLKDGQ